MREPQDLQHDWNVLLMNYEESEYHHLSKEDLLDILQDEWAREFNGILIGRDIESVGRLAVFFYHDNAYVGYESFVKNEWWSSLDPNGLAAQDWDNLVRLTPDDAQDFSFRRCSIISKEQAWMISCKYIDSLTLTGLFLETPDGCRPEMT